MASHPALAAATSCSRSKPAATPFAFQQGLEPIDAFGIRTLQLLRSAPLCLVRLMLLRAAMCCIVPLAASAAAPTLEHLYPVAVQLGSTNIITAIGKFDPWPPKVWV